MQSPSLLDIQHLSIQFQIHGGQVHAVRDLSLSIQAGETLAIVGESGCGKSVTCNAIMGLLPKQTTRIGQGKILFKGKNLLDLNEKEMRELQGNHIAMIFQDPMTALNPTLTIGEQLTEGVIRHQKLSQQQARDKAVKMLSLVGIANPRERLEQYPHQLSGGMRQRVVIAIALMCEPELLIADEPTTALDVTIQAQILELFSHIQAATGVAIILITHDLGVVAQIANKVAVMYAGQCVESGTQRDIFYNPQHPYTQGLLQSMPSLDMNQANLHPIPGQPPDLFSPPAACGFYTRCPKALVLCNEIPPEYHTISRTQQCLCWLQDLRTRSNLTD
ncbi:MAG: ABC transporter ATP-binding protein [Alcaligenaceae bacterium]|nr:ABC transporter ATP-binding protein [Alcaligenaceae bacterium]